METKKSKVLKLIKEGKNKEALRIVKDFTIEFSQSERRILSIAYESLAGNRRFYDQIGEDVDYIIGQAEALLQWYLTTEKLKQ